MKDFLWMVYLILTLFISLIVAVDFKFEILSTNYNNPINYRAWILFIVSLLWSIWYIYFLH